MKRLSLLLLPAFAASALAGPSQVGGRVSPDGAEEIQIDLPGAEQLHNAGGLGPRGPGTGAGLCVFTSVEMGLGRWPSEEALRGFQQKMTREPGGGYPEKVDAMMAKYAPGVRYGQYVGPDAGVLKLILSTGRMPGVTYGYSPRYAGPGNPQGRVAHMVNLVHFTDRWAAVLDNNFVPQTDAEKADPRLYEWMPPDEFVRRWQAGQPGGQGWAVFGFAAPPPPIPVNRPAPKPAAYRWDPGRALGGWGGGACPLAGPVGPLVPPTFPAPALRPGKGGCCSDLCTCGCNAGGDCPCCGRKAAAKPDAKTADKDKEKGDEKIPNFGMEADKVGGDEVLTICGRRAERRELADALAGVANGQPVSDADRQRLTVIGTVEECKPVLDDLDKSPKLAGVKDKLLVKCYAPDHWAVKSVGLPADGHPTIVLQGPPDEHGRGVVLHHATRYDGPEALAAAVRRADPNYDPRQDPDLNHPPDPPKAPDPPPAAPAQPAATAAAPVDWKLCLAAGVAAGLVGWSVLVRGKETRR
jgi:hypothetical protein